MTSIPNGALMAFQSRVKGRNASVIVWPNRIEWSQRPILLGRTKTDMLILRSVSSVSVKKSLIFSDISIVSGTSTLMLRVSSSQAAELQRIIHETIS